MPEKRVLSLNAMDKIIRGTGLRVADEAKEALAEVLLERGRLVALAAKKYAEHAGRRTITAKDIQLAIKE